MNKMKDYVKKHKYYLSVMFVFTLFLSILVSQVVLYADDFALHQKALTYDFSVVLNEFAHVYMHWGGGPTPGLAIMVLMIGLTFWKVMNVFMVTSSIHMITNLVTIKKSLDDKTRATIAAVLWSLLFLMNISIARETLYWFDGSMAYILPAFLSITYIYQCYHFIVLKKEIHWWNYILMIILGFFAGWNSPQAGAITVFIAYAFLVWEHFFKKEKVNKLIFVSNLFLLLGFAILYFAPGNDARMATFAEYSSLGLVGKIFYRMNDVVSLVTNYHTYPSFNIPTYLFGTSIFIVLLTLKQKKLFKNKKYMNLALGFIISYVTLHALYIQVNSGYINHLLSLIFNYEIYIHYNAIRFMVMCFNYFFFISYVLSLIYLSWNISIQKKEPLLLFSILGAIGTQAMMLMSPYSPYRSTYITVLFFIMTIGILVYELINDKKSLCLGFILVMYFYNLEYALFLTIIFVLFNLKEEQKYVNYFLLIGLLIPTISTLGISFIGYRNNKVNNQQNIAQIEKYKKNGQKGTLKLYKMSDETYSFTPIYSDIEWIRHDVIEYFDLKKDVKIVVVENEQK